MEILEAENLISIIQYAKLVNLTRGRIYQLIGEKDERIKIVKIAGKNFVDITRSKKLLT